MSTWDHLACRLFFGQKSYCTSQTFNVTVLIQRDDVVLKLGERFFFSSSFSFFFSNQTGLKEKRIKKNLQPPPLFWLDRLFV